MKDIQMTDMKMSRSEARKNSYPVEISTSKDSYPYGLCIRLESSEMEKLNMKSLPAPGEIFYIQAVAKVHSTYVNEHEEEECAEKAVSLQITDMALSKKYGAK